MRTCGAIVGHYERGEITPSIEVSVKVVRAFRVTLDVLDSLIRDAKARIAYAKPG